MSVPAFVMVTTEELKSIVKCAVAEELGAHTALLVDKQGLAARLGCSAAHIDNLRKRGLPIIKVGEAIRFDPAAVIDWLKAATDNE